MPLIFVPRVFIISSNFALVLVDAIFVSAKFTRISRARFVPSKAEAAEHLSFCDYCLLRYTAMIDAAPDCMKQPMRDLIPQVQSLMRLRSFRIMTNRYVSTAAAVMLAFALWRFGFFGGVGTVQKSVQQLPDVTPRVTVSQALGGMFDSMSSGLSNMFDGMQLTINSGLAQLADPVVPRSNPTNNGGSPAHGE